jgi:hypothetical protein
MIFLLLAISFAGISDETSPDRIAIDVSILAFSGREDPGVVEAEDEAVWDRGVKGTGTEPTAPPWPRYQPTTEDHHGLPLKDM